MLAVTGLIWTCFFPRSNQLCVRSCTLLPPDSWYIKLINKWHSSLTALGINIFVNIFYFLQLGLYRLQNRITTIFMFIYSCRPSLFNQNVICLNTVHVLTNKQLHSIGLHKLFFANNDIAVSNMKKYRKVGGYFQWCKVPE